MSAKGNKRHKNPLLVGYGSKKKKSDKHGNSNKHKSREYLRLRRLSRAEGKKEAEERET